MVLDVLILLALSVFVLSCYRKGLIMSLCVLASLVVACMGATAAQRTLSPMVEDWLRPQIEDKVEEKVGIWIGNHVDEAMEDAGEAGIRVGGKELTINDVKGLLESLGVPVEESVNNAADRVSEPVVEVLSQGVTELIVTNLAKALVWLLAFLILYLVVSGVLLIVNVVDKLPVIHTLNHVGGGIVGLLGGVLLIVAVVYAMEQAELLGDKAFGSFTLQFIRDMLA